MRRRALAGNGGFWRDARRTCVLPVLVAGGCMGWFGEPRIEERTRDRAPTEARGPLTARQALDVVLPAVEKASRKYRLEMVVSGEDIGADGRSSRWELMFGFPSRHGVGVFTVEPCDMETSEADLCVVTELRPRSSRSEPAAFPLEFRDSPLAVAEMADAGVDWVAGSTRANLATRRKADGSMVWVTEMFGQEYETPFVDTSAGDEHP